MKPLCSLCGDRHESYQAHVFAKPIPVRTEEMAVVNAVVNKKKNPDRHKDKGARRKYMAEYMRKRRSKA